MIINNMIVLGRAAPELYKGRQSVTVLGYSGKQGFIRLYPTRVDSPLKQWSIVDVEVEKNPADKRKESWRIKDSKDWKHLNDKIRGGGRLNHKGRLMLAKRLAASLESLDNGGSIALVRPQNMNPVFETTGHRKVQKTLTQFDIINKDDYEARLFIEYNCSALCRKLHRHWVIEWGIYEALRKNPKQPDKMLADLHLNDKRYDKYFLLGSRRGNKKDFVIASVLRFKRFNTGISRKSPEKLSNTKPAWQKPAEKKLFKATAG
jgi:hypothetical protein